MPEQKVVTALRAILREHNRLEEEAGGLYEKTCEELIGSDVEAILKGNMGWSL